MAKGKQKQKKKRSSGCGFPAVLLVLLCLFVAVAYWKPEVKLPESVRETVDAVGNRMEEQLADMKAAVSEQWNRLEEVFSDLKRSREEPEEPAAPPEDGEPVVTMDTLPA